RGEARAQRRKRAGAARASAGRPARVVTKESAPSPGRSKHRCDDRWGRSSSRLGGLGVDHLGGAVADLDLPGLHRLRYLTDEIDVQQPVGEGRALDLDVIGQLEPALERTGRDAL